MLLKGMFKPNINVLKLYSPYIEARYRSDILQLLISIIGMILFQMAQILPTDETFLLLFQLDHPLDSSVDFMRVSLQNNALLLNLNKFNTKGQPIQRI